MSAQPELLPPPALDNPPAPDGEPPHGPLSGIRVLDVATIYAGPLAAMLLGDYGADVIKVEHPKGDPARTHGHSKDGHGLWWKVISRNKRAITCNLSMPRGQELFLKLVAQTDVLVENFRPGVLESWHLSPERLHEINPGLVILRVTGFGQFGPYKHRRAFGTLAEAMSGFAHMTGEADGPPTLPPFGLADGLSGLAGALAVSFALRERARNGGRGQVVDLALIEPILTILGPAPSVYDQLGVVAGRHGNRSPNNAPRNTYRTSDGKWVAVSASATSVAARVMTLVGHPEVCDEPWFASAGQRVQHADELNEMVASWIAQRELAEVARAFEEAGAALAPVYDVADLLADPQIKALQSIITVDDDDLGPLKMQNVMFRMSETPGEIRFAGRRLGQDNAAVYGGALGLSAAEIAELLAQGVL